MSTRCFAIRRCGKWIGVARVGSDEHQTIAGYDMRGEAEQAAREIAARLHEAALRDIETYNALTPLERAWWHGVADSERPCDAVAAFKIWAGRVGPKGVPRL